MRLCDHLLDPYPNLRKSRPRDFHFATKNGRNAGIKDSATAPAKLAM